MAKRTEMTKHRGFPSGLPGHGHHFTIRRPNEKAVTPLKPLTRLARPNTTGQKVDAAFLHALWHHFGTEPFERGNLDAGRLNLLFGREVIPAESPFDPASYEALLQIDERVARKSFPESFEDVFEV
ncbi:MAG TPA: hypothetical protein VL202_12400 [Pararhizobium sp.]|uniref:hypothetical protein n=1 Tax=Pararhizobium sp. TaxID=1977563 RepID=UPI002C252414|nr:hypothetical protein [Pararhizobium sp.]HTO31963.1 hypothetical protein [Pararhizobium sp.]